VKEGNQGEGWKLASVELTLQPPETAIFIEAKCKEWNYGDIVIDDFEFSLGYCPPTKARKANENEEISRLARRSPEMSVKNSNSSETIQEFEKWSDWSECSQKCGVGQQIREIICLSTSSNCDPNLKQIRNCLIEVCNVGTWSEWGDWSQCKSKSMCENKYQTRLRNCLSQPCIGEPMEIRLCEDSLSPSLEKYCNKESDNLKLDVSCGYSIEKEADKQKIEHCKLVNPEDPPRNGDDNDYIELISFASKYATYGSYLINKNFLNDNSRLIKFKIEASIENPNQQNQYCFQMFYINNKPLVNLNEKLKLVLNIYDSAQNKYIQLKNVSYEKFPGKNFFCGIIKPFFNFQVLELKI
jgi:hypothetical protein